MEWGVMRCRYGFQMEISAFSNVGGREKTLSHTDDSPITTLPRETYSIRRDLWPDKGDSLRITTHLIM